MFEWNFYNPPLPSEPIRPQQKHLYRPEHSNIFAQPRIAVIWLMLMETQKNVSHSHKGNERE